MLCPVRLRYVLKGGDCKSLFINSVSSGISPRGRLVMSCGSWNAEDIQHRDLVAMVPMTMIRPVFCFRGLNAESGRSAEYAYPACGLIRAIISSLGLTSAFPIKPSICFARAFWSFSCQPICPSAKSGPFRIQVADKQQNRNKNKRPIQIVSINCKTYQPLHFDCVVISPIVFIRPGYLTTALPAGTCEAQRFNKHPAGN